MRGHTVLRLHVHLFGADLHFQGLALGTDDRGVERAVCVRLRARDVVVEFALDRCPQVVHDAEHRVALADVADDHAHGTDVVEPLEGHVLAAHLSPDRIEVLRPPLDRRGDAHRTELGLELRDDALDVGLAVVALLVEELRDLPVEVRLGEAEGVILELPLELRHAETVGERREELERLPAGGAPQRFVRLRERAQVHHALGERDEDDAHILRDREEHLAQLLEVHARGVQRLDAPGARDAA